MEKVFVDRGNLARKVEFGSGVNCTVKSVNNLLAFSLVNTFRGGFCASILRVRPNGVIILVLITEL